MKQFLLLRRILIPCLFSLFIFILACTKDNNTNPNNQNVVSGVIKDEQDNPVPNATIEAINSGAAIQGLLAKDTTDEDGKFTLSGLPDNLNSIDLKISHEDFKTYQAKAATIIGKNDKKNFPVKILHEDSCCGKINLTVLKMSDSTPVNDAEVRLNRKDTLIRKSYTNSEGKLSFEFVCPGSYWFRIAKEGFKVIEQEFELKGCDTLNFTFYLIGADQQDSCCNGAIFFNVKDSTTGLPIPNVTLNLWKGSIKLGTYQTNGDGNYNFTKICQGEYQISLSKDGYVSQEFNFTMGCNDTVHFNKLMIPKDSCCNGKIKVIPKDKDTQEPLNGATVKLLKNGTLLSTKTVENGYALFGDLCDGIYRLSITKDGYNGIEFSDTLGCNGTQEVVKMMEKKQDSCCKGAIFFNVKDSTTGKPISNVTLNLWKGSTKLGTYQTNGDGNYNFTLICQGEYQISFSKDGYVSQEFNFTMGCNDSVHFNKLMVPTDTCCNGKIKVIPKDKDSQEPLNGATVKLLKNGTLLSTKTVENGYAIFEKLCDGIYRLSITKDGYNGVEFSDTLGCNGTQEVVKLMEKKQDSCCKGAIFFNVKDSTTGQPIPNVTLNLWKGSTKLGTYQTNGDGNYTFTLICQGEYQISFSKDGYVSQEFNFTMGCNDTVHFNKLMVPTDTCCNGKIKVIPKDKDSQEALNGATVKLLKNGTLLSTKTVENGYAIFEKLCDGIYRLNITKDGYNGVEFSDTLGCNQTQELVEEMQKKQSDTCCTAILKLKIIDNDTEQPISGAAMKVYIGDNLIKDATSNDEGWATVDGLCYPSTYNVKIMKDGYQTKVLDGITFPGCNLKSDTVRLIKQ
jgi:5-hydroxyisourate hydrolase-like protein (transthyretin family)